MEVIAKGDVPTENEHVVRMGKGQRSGMRLLLACLDEWSKK